MNDELRHLRDFESQPTHIDPQTRERARATLMERADSLNQAQTPKKRKKMLSRRPRRLIVALVATVALSAGVAGAAGLFSSDDIAVGSGIGCYERALLDSDVTVIAAAPDPVATCADLWKRGAVDGSKYQRAPQLVACTGKDQPVRVFPGDEETCANLDLELLPSDYAGAARQVAKLDRVFLKVNSGFRFEREVCVSPDAVAAALKLELSARGLDGTRVRVGSGPCASYATRGSGPGHQTYVVPTVSRAMAEQRWGN